MTAIDIEGVIIIVITIKNLDSIDIQAVAGQIVLHPAATVPESNILHRNVLALDESKQVRTRDAFIVPRQLFEGTSSSVNDTIAVDGDIAHLVSIDKLNGRGMST